MIKRFIEWWDLICEILFHSKKTYDDPAVPPESNGKETAPVPPPSAPVETPVAKPETVREMIFRVCGEVGLDAGQTKDLYQTVLCESQLTDKVMNGPVSGVPPIVHPNVVNGKTYSTDYGICQWNDYYHGKEISPQEALNDPEKSVELMARYWKNGLAKSWVCYQRGLYKGYAYRV